MWQKFAVRRCEFTYTTSDVDAECPKCELPVDVNYLEKAIIDLNPAFESKLISISECDAKS